MADWGSVELKTLVDPIRGISYGIVQPGSPAAGGIPIVRVGDVRNGRIQTSDAMRVYPPIEAAYSRTRLRGGELLITIVGTVGETAIVPASMAGWNVARAIAVLPVRSEVGAYWVKLALCSDAAKSLIRSRLNTTVQATLNLGDLAKLPILMPPAIERQRIACLLGALDDKIDLNRRMNETLEAMARAIFKDWFVDFGPTRAKMEGRPPYLSPEIWALFPDRLDDEGKPEGWVNARLSQLATQTKGTVDPSLTPMEMFEHYSLPSFDAGQAPAFEIGASIKSNKTPIPDNTILLSKLNPEISRVWVPEGVRTLRQITSTEFLVFQPKQNSSVVFLFALFKDPAFRAMLQGMATGTSKSHQRISPPALLEQKVLACEDRCIRSFTDAMEPLLRRVLLNRFECRSLAASRDLLLPKLMSGELRVRDADELAEAAL